MNKYKGQQTPGVVFPRDERSSGGQFMLIRQAPEGGLLDSLHLARIGTQDGGEEEANAALYAEAHNVANQSGLWPAELLEECERLREVLKAVWNSGKLSKSAALGDIDHEGTVSKFSDPLTQQVFEAIKRS
jgi:hypothetical protein